MDSLTIDSLTGSELRKMRRDRGVSQVRMAELIECSRHAVIYWEKKAGLIDPLQGCPARMLQVLGVKVSDKYTSTRARGHGLLAEMWKASLAKVLAEYEQRERQRASRRRLPCQAQTRKGLECRNLSEPGRRRCKFHGGKSTGPKTPEGKARIAEAQRARWRHYRAARAIDHTLRFP